MWSQRRARRDNRSRRNAISRRSARTFRDVRGTNSRLGFERLESRDLLAGVPVITEFLASNQGGLPDGDGNNSDWIEIYNAGDMPVNLAGYYLTDDQADLTAWSFPSVELDSGEFLVVFASSQQTNNYVDAGGNLHTNFALGAGGEYVALVAPDGTTIVSQFAADGSDYPEQFPDISYGASADGLTVGYFLTPTPGAPNNADPVSDPNRRILINELMYHPPGTSTSEVDEWLEIANAGSETVDLTGWQINDGVEFTFPTMILNPGAFVVVASDLARFQATHPGVTNVVGGWNGQLSNNGERVRLADELGRTVDTVTYADEGDWSVRAAGPLDHGHRGWIWLDDHDGGGKSLELINVNLSNDFGQNWAASITLGGTPGAANSVVAADIAPLILDTMHAPAIPRSTDPVLVSARLLDELTTGVVATLHWRIAGAASFNAIPMLDNGSGGDVRAGDGVFVATIPPHANATVIEFYVQASDQGGHSRNWPAPTSTSGQVTNLLYQVDNSFNPAAPWTPTSDPIVRLIMTPAERAELADIGDSNNDGIAESESDAQMNGTFVYQDGSSFNVRYLMGFRNRGHGSRDNPPNNYRISFPSDRPWENATSANINSKYTPYQVIGSAIFNLAGLPMTNANPIQVRVNNVNLAESGGRMYGRYAFLEEVNPEFADNHFAPDPDGNLYTARRPTSGNQSDFRYFGTNPNSYRPFYAKQSNESLDDWSDIIQLTNALNNAPQATYVEEVSQVVNIDQWLRHLALEGLLNNGETGLSNGIGDDFDMYRGVNDPRFVLIPHDLDTILGKGESVPQINRSIMLPANVTGLRRFFSHPEILSRYHQAFRDLIDELYNLPTLSPLLHQLLDGWVPANEITQIEQYIVNRTNAVLAQLPAKTPMPIAAGTLTGNMTLTLADSPWQVNGDIVVPAGVMLTIEPGVTVYFAQGAGIDIAGHLVAQGNSAQRITLTRTPGATGTWDGLQFNSTQQDNRLAFVDMSFGDGRGQSIRANSSRLWIDNTKWSGTQRTIIEVQNPSLRVTASVFPTVSIGETIHGTAPQGTPYLILEGNTIGVNTSGDDVVDIGPAQVATPPVQILHNMFLGGGDDGIDLDGVDALVEGNVFMNFHKNTSRATSSNGVATGNSGSNLTDLILRRNLFFNNDHHVLLKDGAFVTSEHNVFFDADIAAIQLTEIDGGEKGPSRGGTFSGDIFWQNAALFAHVRPGVTRVVNQSIVPAEGVGLGKGNIVGDPQFVDIANRDFHVRPTSPAIGTGPGGTDMGAYPDAVHAGVVINEVFPPNEHEFNTQAVFVELFNRGTVAVDLGGMRISDDPSRDKFIFAPGTTIPAGGYLTLLPALAGPGILLGFELSPVGGSLFLRNSAAVGGAVLDSVSYGIPIPNSSVGRLGPDARWALAQPTPGGPNIAQATGDPSALKINEWFMSADVLVSDDFIELYNPSALPVALGGLFLTDDPGARPLRHAIAPLSYIAAGGFASFIADGDADQGANHLGFRLTSELGRIALFEGGPPLVGDFNDDGQVDAADYVVWRKTAGQIVPGGSGADANDDGIINQTDYNLWRSSFGLSSANPGIRTDAAVPYWDVPSLEVIDFVTYMPQTTDYSQGRSPNGGTAYRYFMTPTPGAANPTVASSAAVDSFFAELSLVDTSRPTSRFGAARPVVRPDLVAALADDALLLAALGDLVVDFPDTLEMAISSEDSHSAPDEPIDIALAAAFPTLSAGDL